MSVVIGIKRGDRIFLSADTQISEGIYKSNPLNANEFKIQQVNQFIVGGTGVMRLLKFLVMSQDLFMVSSNTVVNKQWIIQNIVNPFFLLLNKHDFLNVREAGTKYMDLSLIIAYKDVFFLVTESGSVFELSDFVVIGSGSDYVLPFLTHNRNIDDVKSFMLDVLRFTNVFETSISNPYIMIDTVNLTLEKVMY